MTNWQETNWGELVILEYGKSLKDYKDNNGKYPVFGTNGMIGYTDRILCPYPGVIIGRKGAYRGVHYSNKPFFVIDTAFYVKAKKEGIIDLKFAYYKLRNQDINRLDSGSAIPSTSREDFYQLDLSLPPFEEQKKIASILTALDDKISLLRRQNETLEQIAQTIFRHWFVDFEFPNEHGKPYKSSGGKFVSSELGDIPEDWQVGKLEHCISNIVDYRGKTPKKLGMEWSVEGIPAFSAKNIKNGLIVREDTMNFGSEELYEIWMKDEIKKGDILLTSEAPLGELFYLVNPPKFILSQRLFGLRAKDAVFSPYLYYYLKSPQGQLLIKKRATGSTVVGIRQSELREVELLIPSMRVIGEASRIHENILSKIDRNCSCIKNITHIRDILLPKLMSGKIRVK